MTDHDDGAEGDGPDRPRGAPDRPRRRLVVPVVGLVLLVWLGLVGVQAWQASQSTSQGMDELERLRSLTSGGIRSLVASIEGEDGSESMESTAESLETAASRFRDAGGDLDAAVVKPLTWVPFVGRQLDSARSLAAAAEHVSTNGAEAFRALAEQTRVDADSPATRLEAARRTSGVLEELGTAVGTVDLGPKDQLLSPLGSARHRFESDHLRLVETVDGARAAVRGVADFLEGPSRYLVLAANNAEMRAGSGMFLQVGVLEVSGGEMSLGEFTATEHLLLPEPGASLDPDVERLWGWMSPAQEWRNLNATPRFDESARMAADMWSASGRGQVDGVLAVDVIGLENLLELVGPVQLTDQLGATELSAENVTDVLLYQQYVAFVGEQEERRDRLGPAAEAIFEAFNTRSFSTAELIRVLHGSGRGRNLLLWSADADQQRAWESLDTSGALPPEAVLMSLLNREGNKLDQFVEIDAAMTATSEDDVRHVTVRVTLRNSAPEPLPGYIAGAHPRASVAPGDYGGVLALTIPAGAGSPTIDGEEPQIAGNDGPVRVVGREVLVPRGESVEMVIEFDLSTSWTELRVMPSARIPRVSWAAGDEVWKDRRPKTVRTDDLG